jgi:protein-S-isoprenylcysteine O-methyltransferase Ste14
MILTTIDYLLSTFLLSPFSFLLSSDSCLLTSDYYLCTMFTMSHLWLAIFWIIFGIIHSVMAAVWWKKWMMKWMGNYFKYHRLVYSIVANISFVLIIWYQYSFPDVWLWELPLPGIIGASLVAFTGFLIMIVSIRKYSFLQQENRLLFRNPDSPRLANDGIHRHVRHPLYLGTLLFIWSLFFILPLAAHLTTCTMVTLYTLVGIRFEEQKLLQEFGEDYRNYRRNVPMIIPKINIFQPVRK